ncbi:hypothetical protein QF045_003992 [Pseudomonas sp. W4I3]|nr:hypothetical protein [Pseudomonas sp. W4I3]MDQ0980347.1 hypothetical protein [Pseudomonas synxantha]
MDAPETDIDTPTFQGFDLLQHDHFRQAQLDTAIAAQASDKLR